MPHFFHYCNFKESHFAISMTQNFVQNMKKLMQNPFKFLGSSLEENKTGLVDCFHCKSRFSTLNNCAQLFRVEIEENRIEKCKTFYACGGLLMALQPIFS